MRKKGGPALLILINFQKRRGRGRDRRESKREKGKKEREIRTLSPIYKSVRVRGE